MKLETVSRIKGCVALAAVLITIVGLFTLDLNHLSRNQIFYGSLIEWVAIIYTVKWFRLRRRMREWEYRRAVSDRG